jgi:hypothetical protein
MLGDKMNKLVKDGMVAVLYSPDFGAGWYTWNTKMPELLFEPAIVQFLLDDKFDELQTYVELKYPEIYKGGMMELTVAWVPENTQFRISEYDGAESIEIKDDTNWFTA